VFAGGDMTTALGQVARGVVALHGVEDPAGQGADATLEPGFREPATTGVRSLAVAAGRLYVGGTFTTIGRIDGLARVGALDELTGAPVDGWDARIVGGEVEAVAASDGAAYAGGDFTSANALPRRGLAALDADGRVVPGWDAPVDGTVRALALAGGRLVVGGQFSALAGQPRSGLGAVGADGVLDTAWDPQPSSSSGPTAILSLAAASASGPLYAGGQFTDIGGAARANLAALDLSTGHATDWNPGASGNVQALLPACGVVYASGGFTTLGGAARSRIGAVDATSGQATAFDPSANSAVLALRLGPGVLYAGGQFSQIGGQPRARLAALHPETGAATGWNPSADGPVRALGYADATVFAGGDFLTIGPDPREHLAAISATTGAAAGWRPDPGGAVRALDAAAGRLTAGGLFEQVLTRMQRGTAAFDIGTDGPAARCADPPAPPEAPPADPVAEPVPEPAEEPEPVAPSSVPAPRKPAKVYPPPRDRDAPVLSRLRVSGHRLLLARKPIVLRFAVSEAGRLRVVFERRELTACKTPLTLKPPTHKRCYRYRRIGGVHRRTDTGDGTVRLDGMVGGQPLRPGRYRATVAATDATGNYSRAVRLRLLVLR
jgi:hypothetical protein